MNDYVTVADHPELRIPDVLTIEFWAKRQRFGTDIVLEKGGDWTGGGTNYGAALHPSNNNMFYFYFSGGWRGTSGASDTEWHHYAIVARQGAANPQLYIDGMERPVQFSGGAGAIRLYPSQSPLHLGAQAGSYYGKNVLDEVRIWNIARTQAQIQAAMTVPPAVTTPGLVAYWQFDEGTGRVLHDATGHGHHGALGADPQGSDAPTWVVADNAQYRHYGSVAVLVEDSSGLRDTQTFTLEASKSSQNSVPSITSAAPPQAAVDQRYVFNVTAEDPDGDPLCFELTQFPSGMTIDPLSGRIAWIPNPSQLGLNAVTIAVSDGRGGTDTQSFQIDVLVSRDNHTPEIISTPLMVGALERLYLYRAVASDADADLLIFDLPVSPQGMAIDPLTGVVVWLPGAGQVGIHEVSLIVYDGQGGSASQNFAVTVAAANLPPSITSTPSTQATQGQPYIYALRATDPDGDPLAFSLDESPMGMTIDPATGLVRWTPEIHQVGLHTVAIRIEDAQGGFATQFYDIFVTATSPNQAPIITSSPSFVANVSELYIYRADAVDPDGDPILFSLSTSPAGMTIDATSGLVEWTPLMSQSGSHMTTVIATDAHGAVGIQTFILAAQVNEPPVVSPAPNMQVTAGKIFRYDIRATDPNGDQLTFKVSSSPAGMVIDEALGRLSWATDASKIGAYYIEVVVSDTSGASTPLGFGLAVVADTQAPKVALSLSANPAELGTLVTFVAAAVDDVGVETILLTVGGILLALDSTGRASMRMETAGNFEVMATANDDAGNTGKAALVLWIIDPTVTEAPTVAISSPSDPAIVTGPTDVIGTVQDGNLLYYTLSVAPLDDDFTEFFRGNHTVADGLLGRFDPSTLSNGDYILRLYAVNTGLKEAVSDRLLSVAGDLKLGNFAVSFTDLSVPVSGIPIVVTRTYDTLTSSEQDELGYGWRLEIRDTDLRTSVEKTGWEEDLIYNPFYQNARVYVTVPGGGRQAFTFQPQLAPGARGWFLGICQAVFVPDPGVTSTLTVAPADIFPNQYDEFYDYTTGMPYNPASPMFGGTFTLTTKEGIKYEINGETGDAQKISDPSGNALTFTDAGIFSTAGKEIRFERDPQGRISAVIDPSGNRVRYAYDAAGDLVSVTDREGNVTRFVYRSDRPHYLERVIDPLGRTGVRSEYDGQGRLVRMVDAAGKSVQLVHNPDNFTETVVDQAGSPTLYEYDTRGNIVTETNALGGVTRRTYDSQNNVLTETDPLGSITSFTYDSQGNVLTETDPLGRVTRYTYGPFGQVLTTTDPLGNTTTNAYDAGGRLLSTTDPAGNVTRFTYDAAGNPLTMAMPGGGTTSFQYDSAGNVLRQVDALGNATTYSYDANGNRLTESRTVTTPSGPRTLVTTTQYDANGRVAAVTDAEGNITRTEYDAAGNRIAEIDALGRRTEFRYDDRGQLIETIDPDDTPGSLADNPRTRTEYDDAGRELARIDELGRRTQYVYDTLGRLTQTIYPDGTPLDLTDNPRTRTEYDAAGRVKAEIDELGNRTEFQYDAAGNQTLVRDALGNTTTSVYDVAGRRTSQTDALGHTTRLVYDAAGRLTSTVFADGTTAANTFDAAGRISARTDQAAKTTRFEYDAAGRLTAVIDALGQRTQYAYNELGSLVTQTDANGHMTAYEYDGLGRRIATVLPLGQRSTTAYDAAGNVASTMDFNGDTIRSEYDPRNRLTAKRYPDGTSVAFTYTLAGQQATVTDSRGTTSFEYDLRDRLLSRTDPDGRQISYSYDLAGNRTAVTIPSGTTTYTFDALNRMKTVTDPDGALTAYTYDAIGNLTRTALPNGTTETRQYDLLGRLLSLESAGTDGVICAYQYTLDATGNRTAVTEDGGRRVEYAYDHLYRLLAESIYDPGATSPTRTIGYAYHPVGNRLSRNDSAEGLTEYTYDANDRLLTETLAGDSTRYEYDHNGNTLRKVDVATAKVLAGWDWDYENRLVAADTDGDGAADVANQYDAAGIRVSQTVHGDETRFLIDANQPFAQVVEEYTPGGVIKVSYVHGLDLISQNRPAETGKSFYHVDGLGSTRALTNASGLITDRYIHDAFGRTIGQVGSTGNVYLFAGEQRDANLGLDYLRARYLNVGSGRFVSRDAFNGVLTSPTSRHKYVYANANPVANSDPSGKFALMEIATALSIFETLHIPGPVISPAGFGYLGWARLIRYYGVSITEVSQKDQNYPDVLIDCDFLNSMIDIDFAAADAGVGLVITSSFRNVDTVLRDARVTPSGRSNHFVGHAIDFNLETSAGRLDDAQLKKLAFNELPEDAQRFLQSIRDPLRWGGNFSSDVDPVHIDDNMARHRPHEWNYLFGLLQGRPPIQIR